MGQKINPIGFRLAVNRNWSSRWYANSRSFAPMLAEDIKVREFLKRKLAHRSEEHTSELQSRLHLVCRLLLENNACALELHRLWPRLHAGHADLRPQTSRIARRPRQRPGACRRHHSEIFPRHPAALADEQHSL